MASLRAGVLKKKGEGSVWLFDVLKTPGSTTVVGVEITNISPVKKKSQGHSCMRHGVLHS